MTQSAELLQRIQDYLGNGGLFNPEMMEHDNARGLIIDCRTQLQALQDAYDCACKTEASCREALGAAMKENVSLRLAVGDDTLSLLSKLEAERKRVGELQDALAFYADTHNYHDAQWSSGEASIQQDNGRAAREALKK